MVGTFTSFQSPNIFKRESLNLRGYKQFRVKKKHTHTKNHVQNRALFLRLNDRGEGETTSRQ